MLNDRTSIQTHTHKWHTHLCKHTQQESNTQSLFCLPSAHSAQHRFGLPPPNGSLRLQKRTECIISPHSFSLGRFLWEWNWISCVICIHVLSLAIPLNLQQADFRAGEEMEARSWRVWVGVVMKQLETETNLPPPSVHLSPSTPTCCLPSIPLYSLLTASLACQMVLEWILKSWLHWTSITSKLLKTTLTKL